MNYDLSLFNSTNTTNLLQLAQGVNTASNGWFGVLFLLVIFISSYMVFKKEDAIEDFMVSGFITSIISVLLLFAGIVTWYVTIVPIVLFLAAFALYFFI